MAEPNRVPVTVRLRPEDKETLVNAADQAGLEVGIAARMILDVAIRRLRSGESFLKVMGDLERASDTTLNETNRMMEELRTRLDALGPSEQSQAPRRSGADGARRKRA